MKLNVRRTILVGFAFFLICAFWQIYDVTIAMTLTNKFGMRQDLSGIIMALDNILALFMLPLFGGISDRCKSPRGRRTPFITVGTILAVVFLMGLSFVDNAQLANIQKYSKVNDYRERATEAIDEMFSQVGEAEFDKNGIMKKGMIVRHLMLPGLLFDSKKIIDYFLFLKYNTN